MTLFQSCDLNILEEPWNPFDLPPLSFDSTELELFESQTNQNQTLGLNNEPIYDFKDFVNAYNDTKNYQVSN